MLQSQGMTFARLPFEILCAIANDLSFADQKNCSLVCQEWHTVFRCILFRVVKADTRDSFKAFRSILRSSAIGGEQLGFFVQQLTVQDGCMTLKEMNELKEYCPYLRRLTFRYEDDGAHEAIVRSLYEKEEEKPPIHKSRRYFGIPGKLLEMLPVTFLRLECITSPIMYPYMPRGCFMTTAYLAGCSNLHTLMLIRVFRKISLQLLEFIHVSCPQLTTLHIEASINTRNAAFNTSDGALTGDVQGEHCTPTQLRHFCAKSSSYYSNFGLLSWLHYIALRYPLLETIELGDIRASGYSSREPSVAEKAKIYTLFADRCRQLQRVAFNNVSLPRDLVQLFFTDAKQSFTFMGAPFQGLDDVNSTSNETRSYPLQSLSLTFKSTFKDDLLTLLRACHCLTNMTLDGATKTQTYIGLPLQEVLSACPSLRNLKLSFFCVYDVRFLDHAQQPTTPNSIYSLTMIHCNVNWRAMKCIAEYCQGIKYLYLYSCSFEDKYGNPFLCIHLPNCDLRTVELCKPRINCWNLGDGPVQLLSVRLGNGAFSPKTCLFADSDAQWFSFIKEATAACGHDHSADGCDFPARAVCPTKCRKITNPDVIAGICEKIKALQDPKESRTAGYSNSWRGPMYYNARDWKSQDNIGYFGYASLRFGSVQDLKINGTINLVVNGHLQ